MTTMAAETPESTEQKSQASSSPAGGSSTLTIILTSANTLVSVGMLIVLFLSFQQQKTHPSVEDISNPPKAEEAKGEEGKAKSEGEKPAGEKATGEGFGKVI